MRCPYCGSIFELSDAIEVCGQEIITGCLKCDCNLFPIIDEIPIIKDNIANKYYINYIKNGQIQKASALALAISTNLYSYDICRIANLISSKPFGGILESMIMKICNYFYMAKYRCYSNQSKYFWDIAGISDYLRHRFSTQTFWSLYPFIPIIQKKEGFILDLCCGCGHASSLISNYVNDKNIICVDADFKHLYLAKRYFSNSAFINVDVNGQLPFKDSIFSSVIMMDAFAYISARSLLSRELFRVMDADGNLLLTHIHNSHLENVCPGNPLTPANLQNLFKEYDIKILPEDKIIEDFIRSDQLNLSREYSSAELDSSNLILLKTPYIENYVNLRSKLYPQCGNLIINPIYKIKSKNENKIVLKREFPSEYFRKEYPMSESYLIDNYELDLNDLNSKETICNLLGKFILINAPKRYMKTKFNFNSGTERLQDKVESAKSNFSELALAMFCGDVFDITRFDILNSWEFMFICNCAYI